MSTYALAGGPKRGLACQAYHNTLERSDDLAMPHLAYKLSCSPNVSIINFVGCSVCVRNSIKSAPACTTEPNCMTFKVIDMHPK